MDVAQLASIRQMSRQVSRGSVADYEADEQAGVSRLSWRISPGLMFPHFKMRSFVLTFSKGPVCLRYHKFNTLNAK